MKSKISALALFLLTSSAFATNFGSGIYTAKDIAPAKSDAVTLGPVSFNADVGATSNLVIDGRTVTKKNPSVFANVDAKVKTENGVLGLEYGVAKDNGTTNPANSRQDVFASYATSFAGVNLIGKFGEHNFGGLHSRVGSTRDVIVGAEYNGLFAAVDKVVGTTGNATFDMHEKVGYTLDLGNRFSVTGAAAFVQTGKHSVNKFDYAQLSANYAVTKAVDVAATVTKGGRNLTGTSVPSQVGATVSYTF